MIGIVKGLQKVGWGDVPVIAGETDGANCFAEAQSKGAQVTLPAITSIAKSLGALTVSSEALNCDKSHTIYSSVCTDASAVNACINFANDHRILVEPACGAALACVYDPLARKSLASQDPVIFSGDLVVIVCGGNMVTPEIMRTWQKEHL